LKNIVSWRGENGKNGWKGVFGSVVERDVQFFTCHDDIIASPFFFEFTGFSFCASLFFFATVKDFSFRYIK